MSLHGNASLTDTHFGKDAGVILQTDILPFFTELGQMISQANSTFDKWQKENADQWQALLDKYL